MLRKHILAMSLKKLETEQPFYAWECITLEIKGRPDIYLIIQSEKIMSMFIKLLIYKIKTIDGYHGTMEPMIMKIVRKETKNKPE